MHPVEPAESPTLTTGKHQGHHRIQGISDEFVPPLLSLSELDEVQHRGLVSPYLQYRGLVDSTAVRAASPLAV